MREKKVVGLSETTEHDVLLTPWSAVHFGVGGVAGQLKIGFWWFQIIHGAYEVKDFLVTKQGDMELYNSTYNSIGDHITATLGWFLGRNYTSFYWKTMLVGSYGTVAILGHRVG
jgi:hypothetical protein